MVGDGRWQQFRLEDVCDQITDGKHGDCQDEAGSGYYFLSAKSVKDGRLLHETGREITKEDFEETHKRTRLEPGDILFTNTGTIGRMAIASDDELTSRTTFQKSVALLKPTRSIVEPLFLYYLLRYDNARLSEFAHGTTQKNLLLKDFRAFLIEVPPLPEQKAIARILGTLDDKIELNRRMNETLEGMARAIFKSWFVDFDPVRAKMDARPTPALDPATAKLFPDGFEHTSTGLLPAGWSVGRIRDLCLKIENGGTPKRQMEEYWAPEEVPWLTSGEVRLGYIVSTENFISREGLASSSAKMWPSFATVVALYGATAGFASLLGMELCANQACCALLSDDHAACFTFLKASSSMDHFAQQARGSAQQNLSQALVADLPAVIPPEKTLSAFEQKVHPLLARCIQNLQESASLGRLRDTLLPKLLSGELRVADAERITRRYSR